MCSSTEESNFVNEVSFTRVTPSSGAYCFSGSTFSAAARYFFPRFGILLFPDCHAHGTGRAFDHAHRGLDVVGIQILHFDLGDLAHLGARNVGRDGATRIAAALV